jgi:outer membrane protein OmpA-like peptidoglycan-associated protein
VQQLKEGGMGTIYVAEQLSERRAQAVADHLVSAYKFNPARFQVVGNGPDKPIGDNATAEGREKNRRTDFRIIPNN